MSPLRLFRSGALDAAKVAKIKEDERLALKEVIDLIPGPLPCAMQNGHYFICDLMRVQHSMC